MDLLERLAVFDGIARRSQLGLTVADRRVLTEHLAAGRLRDLGGGWLASTEVDSAVVAARRLGGTITCVSAAPFYRLATLTDPDHPHVAVRRTHGIHRPPLPVRLHRESLWTPPARLPLAPPGEVLGRVLRCRPATEAIVIVDSALNRGLVSVEQLGRDLAGPGSPIARATLARCDRRSRSPIETLARLALRDGGLRVEAGVFFEGVGEVDLLVEGKIVVECDGFAYHSGRAEYRADRQRDRALVAMGLLVLRFTWEEIMNDSTVVLQAVLRVLSRP